MRDKQSLDDVLAEQIPGTRWANSDRICVLWYDETGTVYGINPRPPAEDMRSIKSAELSYDERLRKAIPDLLWPLKHTKGLTAAIEKVKRVYSKAYDEYCETINVLKRQSANSKISADVPDTCTLWYNKRTGKVYGIGDNNPAVGVTDVETAKLLWDRKKEQAIPEIYECRENGKALRKALQEIRDYNKTAAKDKQC